MGPGPGDQGRKERAEIEGAGWRRRLGGWSGPGLLVQALSLSQLSRDALAILILHARFKPWADPGPILVM